MMHHGKKRRKMLSEPEKCGISWDVIIQYICLLIYAKLDFNLVPNS